jgi:hypothetical protein
LKIWCGTNSRRIECEQRNSATDYYGGFGSETNFLREYPWQGKDVTFPIPSSEDGTLTLLPFRTGDCSTNHFNIIMVFGGRKQDELCSLHLIVAVF